MATQWYKSDDLLETGRTAIAGATGETFTPTGSENGKFLDRVKDGVKSRKSKQVKFFTPFESLKNIIAEWDFEAMTPGTYTTIPDVSGNGLDLTMGLGTNITIAVNGSRTEAVFDGAKTLRQTNKAFLKRLHDGTVKWTIMIECRIGNTSNPDIAYGIIGSNGSSAGNPGIAVYADNRSSLPAVKRLTSQVTRGTLPSPLSSQIENVVPYNDPTFIFVSWNPQSFQDNKTLASQFNNFIAFVDGLLEDINVNTSSGVYNTANATYDLEIGAVGNGVLPFIGGIHRIVVWQDVLSIKDRQLLQSSKTWTPNTIAKRYIEPAVRLTIDNNYYTLGNMVAKNPISGKVVVLYQQTRSHFEISVPCDMYIRTSTDGGLSWTEETKLWDDNINKKSIYGTYLPSGRLIVLYTEYSRTETIGGTSRAGMEIGWVSRYSDDDGVTWSTKTSITGVPAYFVRWVNYENPIIGSDGNIYSLAYGINGKLDTQSSYAIHVIKSTNNGVSFAFDKLIYQGTTYINECSIVETSANKFKIAARNEANPGQHNLFSWDKVADTVTNHGLWSLDGANDFVHPPMMRKLVINGTDVIAYYFVSRIQHRSKVIYVKASVLESSNVAAFTGRTRFTMSLLLEREASGYTNVIHTSGLAGIGAYSNEKGPSSTNATTSMRCELVLFNLPTNHLTTVISELVL